MSAEQPCGGSGRAKTPAARRLARIGTDALLSELPSRNLPVQSCWTISGVFPTPSEGNSFPKPSGRRTCLTAGYRIASVLRLRHIVSVGKKMIQCSCKDGPDTTKRRRRKGNRSPATLRPLTEKQTEAMALVAEADGNVFEAAPDGGSPYDAQATLSGGIEETRQSGHQAWHPALPVDRRGQPNIAQGGDRRE